MTSVSNKTKRPLSIPLPRGKTLHLGPGKSAEIAANAVDHAPLKKMAEAGDIEIISEDSRAGGGIGGNKAARTFIGGHTSGVAHRGGDR